VTAFAVSAIVMVAIACACVLVPLLRRRDGATEDDTASSLAVLRDQRAELEADRANGVLSPDQYEAARAELERRVLEETGDSVAAPSQSRTGAWSAAAIGAGLPLTALLLYVVLGTPVALLSDSPAMRAAAPKGMAPQDIEGMIERVKERLASNPADVEGWRVLAKTYAALGRLPEALPAYERATLLAPDDADLLADHADALAASQNRSLEGRPEALVARALRADPMQWKANALAGTLAFQRGQFAKAVEHWERVKGALPADSPVMTSIDASLAEARSRASAAPATPESRIAGNAGKTPTPATAGTAAAATIAGTVSLSPSIATGAQPEDTVFVFARPADGSRMPIALVRARVRDLPLAFTLDDSTTMLPDRKLSQHADVVVGARVSRSGNAAPQPGDLEASVQQVKTGARNIALVIDRKLP
jgi:cytochrome c-type biogenesis protein CcmH